MSVTGPKHSEINELPKIYHRDDNLSQAVDQTLQAVAPVELYGIVVFGDRLHHIFVTEHAEEGSVVRPAGAVLLHPVDATHFAEVAGRAALHLKWDRRAGENKKGEDRPVNCPRRVAETVVSLGHWPQLKKLVGVVEAPTITAAGRLLDKPGYDIKTGLYLVSRPDGYAPPATTSLAAARAAVARLLDEVFSSFPFVGDEDRSAMLAALITALVRRALPSAPLIAIVSPAASTGKSTATDIVSLVACGHVAPMMSVGSDENEFEKRLYSSLGAGDSVLSLDNITQVLRSPLLCQVTTQSHVKYRPLGHSSVVTVPTSATIVANGNNLIISGDLPSRTLLIRLDAKTERPDLRHFDRDILSWVAQNRGWIIQAALTIPLAYIRADSPYLGGAPCRFREWDKMVRRALIWCGQPDPLLPSESIRSADPDAEERIALFSAWAETFFDHGATVSDALAESRRTRERNDGDYEPLHPALRSAIRCAIGDKMEAKALAGWLRRHKDQRVTVERADNSKVTLQLQSRDDKHLKQKVWSVSCG